MTTNEEFVTKFIQQAKTQTKVTPPISFRKKRLFFGIIISISVAAIYSSSAELFDIVQVPGVPLYFQPFGMIGNVLYMMFLSGLASLAVTWSEKASSGMMLGGFILFIGIEFQKFLSSVLFSSLFYLRRTDFSLWCSSRLKSSY